MVDRINWRRCPLSPRRSKSSANRRPDIGAYPTVNILYQIFLLACLAVVEHQPEAVALVSRTLLGAVGDVAAIGRIERRRVAGGIVGGDVLGRASDDRDDPQIVVGGSRRILVVIRGVANLLPVGREGVIVLPAEREDGCVVVAGSEVASRPFVDWPPITPGRDGSITGGASRTKRCGCASLPYMRSNGDRAVDRRSAP